MDMDIDMKDKRLPFDVPENYFEDFAARMEARLAEEMKEVVPVEISTKGRVIDLRRIATLVASAAAVFAGLFVVGVGLMNVQENVERQAQEIIAQESYDDEVLEMLDIYQLELALADAQVGIEE